MQDFKVLKDFFRKWKKAGGLQCHRISTRGGFSFSPPCSSCVFMWGGGGGLSWVVFEDMKLCSEGGVHCCTASQTQSTDPASLTPRLQVV